MPETEVPDLVTYPHTLTLRPILRSTGHPIQHIRSPFWKSFALNYRFKIWHLCLAISSILEEVSHVPELINVI